MHRLIDTFSDGTFQPDLSVTRADFANALVTNGALRQSLADIPAFTDITGPQEAITEAVTAQGSTLRDYDFNHTGLMRARVVRGWGNVFTPTQAVTRLDMAVALVKALGLDDAAKAKAGTDVTVTTNGQTLVLADESQIPSELRGYVQLALDRQILQAFFTLQQGQFAFSPTLTANFNPADPVSRATLAVGLLNTRKAFVKGN